MEKVLNQEEIDAMVRAARGGGSTASGSGPQVKPWDVRQAGQIGREQLRSLSVLHEGFARNLTHSLGAYLRVVFEAALVSAEHLVYREFLQRIPETTYLASCRLEPMGVMAVLQLDLSVAFPIVDLLLGGEGRSGTLVREITEIEEGILESIVRIICRELQTAWQSLSLEFCFDQKQQLGQVQRLMPPEEKTLSLSFEITMPDTRGTLNLAVPAVVSNAFLRKISVDWAYQKPRGPAHSKDQIKQRLMDCPFDLELAVMDMRVPAKVLAQLSPGDVLTMRRPANTPATLVAGELEMFSARIVRYGKARAGQLIERRLPPAPRKEGRS